MNWSRGFPLTTTPLFIQTHYTMRIRCVTKNASITSTIVLVAALKSLFIYWITVWKPDKITSGVLTNVCYYCFSIWHSKQGVHYKNRVCKALEENFSCILETFNCLLKIDMQLFMHFLMVTMKYDNWKWLSTFHYLIWVHNYAKIGQKWRF